MNEQQLIEEIQESKIITILRGLDEQALVKTVEAMAKGGIRFAEVTFSATGEPSDETVAEYIRVLASRFAGRVHIGAGTVLTERQVALAANAGAEFIISPGTNPEIIRKTKSLGLVSIPGAFTPSEATAANRVGADFIKLFPNSEVKISYLKALAVPLSHIRFLAVGGVNDENLPEYLAAGAKGVGIATGIVNKKLIAAGDFEGITALAEKYVRAASI